MENENIKPEETKKPEENIKHGVSVKTVVLIVVLALIATVLVFIALPKNQKDLLPKLINKEAVNPADTTLAISDAQKNEDTTYSSIVSIDTGKNNVNAVQIELIYDPNAISNVKVTPMDFFPEYVELLNNVDNKNGRISYALAVAPGQERTKGAGDIAKITYTINQSSVSTSFNFLPKTDVAGDTTAVSLLKSTTNGTINIEAPVSTTSAQ